MSTIHKANIGLFAARRAIATSLAEATSRGVNVCVIVLDEAGRFVAGENMERASNASFDIAFAKARHAANFGRATKFQEKILSEGVLKVLAIPGIIPVEGGIPIEIDGEIVGAIGVSGAASTVDGEIAEMGLASIAKLPV